jgi:acid phosphatase
MLKRALPRVLLLGLVVALVCPLRAVEPVNLSVAKRTVAVYVNSGNYNREIAEVALQANKYLAKRILKGAKGDKKLAVVFDIDETTLTNLGHMMANDFGYVPEIWDAWVAEGRAHAIVPVQTVYDTAVRGKIDVFFVTGRKDSDRPGTEKNLREVGYDTWTKIYYKADNDKRSTEVYKTAVRKQLEADGYVIVANIGDQLSDLDGGHAERVFKLPNPFYLIK